MLSAIILTTQSDERLAALAASGSEAAFEAIVGRYRRDLLAFGTRLLRSDSRGEDIVQQALLSAWTALRRGAEVRELRPWLYRITYNQAVSTLRRPGEAPAAQLVEEAYRAGDSAESESERRALMRETLTAVASLPEQQREALLGTAVAGDSYEQVAAAMGLSDTAIRGLVHRARRSLRAAVAVVSPAPLVAWAARRPAGMPAALGDLLGNGTLGAVTSGAGPVAAGAAGAAGTTGAAAAVKAAAVLATSAVVAGGAVLGGHSASPRSGARSSAGWDAGAVGSRRPASPGARPESARRSATPGDALPRASGTPRSASGVTRAKARPPGVTSTTQPVVLRRATARATSPKIIQTRRSAPGRERSLATRADNHSATSRRAEVRAILGGRGSSPGADPATSTAAAPASAMSSTTSTPTPATTSAATSGTTSGTTSAPNSAMTSATASQPMDPSTGQATDQPLREQSTSPT